MRPQVDNALLEGRPVRPLLRLALPFMAGNLLSLTVVIVDRLWVGRIGTESLAALGTAQVVLMVFGTLMMGMGIGTLAGVARFTGAGRPEEAARYYGRGMVLSVGLGLFFAALGATLPHHIIAFMGAKTDVAAPAIDYLAISMYGLVFQAPLFVQSFALQGAGEARAALIVSAIAPAVNAALDPLLIFGFDMGLPGAAWASNAGYAVGVLTGSILLASGRLRLRPTRASFRRGEGTTRRIIAVGVPGTVEHLVRTLASFSLVKIITVFGAAVVSAYTISLVVVMSLIYPGLAIGQAAATLMGQNLGAGRPDRAWSTAWIAVGLYLVLMIAAALLLYTFAEPLIAAFDDNPEVIAEGAQLMRVQVLCFPTVAVALVLSKGFGGAGHTLPAMASAATAHLAFQIPAAWWFSRQYGPVGAYGAMAGAYGVHAAIQVVLFTWRFHPRRYRPG
ncbi:MAG: MATE family efflux transporter [Myxococcales bacterium]|nr:MATE family efflux transporter [Myxococcales bacterium]